MIGNRIKILRLEKGSTQKQLSEYLGLTPKMISFYEKEERFPPHDIILKLADYFDVTTDYLLGRSDKKKYSAYTTQQLKLNEKNIEEKKLIDFYKELNDIGKKEAIKRVNELTEINKYTTPVTIAAHNDDNTKEQLELMNQDIDEL